MKPHIKVVGAAIVKDGKLLALRRAYGDAAVINKYEFVGGKINEGETPEQALIRECKEELSLDIEVNDLLNTIDYDYPQTTVTLSIYFVTPLSKYEIKFHNEESWIDIDKIDPSLWAPADRYFLGNLKNGYTKTMVAKTEKDFEDIKNIAKEVMHETYDNTTPQGQIDYMLDKFLTKEAIENSIREQEYTYKVIHLNGEAMGFFAYCPACKCNPNYLKGTYFSKVYIKKYARGKKFLGKIISSLPRPIYISVKKDCQNAINIFKHYGFKMQESVKIDIGNGYYMDDFLMVFGK